MKNLIIFILSLVFIFSLTACQKDMPAEKAPELPENTATIEKPAGEDKTIPPETDDEPAFEIPSEHDAICRDILMCFGAMENAAGDLITPKGQPTAFDADFFDDASKAPAETYFYFMFHFMPEEAKADFVMGKKYIYFKGTNFFIYADKFFGADAGYLKSLDIYHEDGEFFFHEIQGMQFDELLEVLSYTVDGNVMEINIRRVLCDGEKTVDSVLRAEFYGIGDFRYLSYLEKTE